MSKWIRRLRGALATGVTWAGGWGLGGIAIGLSTFLPWHPFERFMQVFDAPLPALALPGFFGGVFFSVVLGVAGGRQRFRDLSTMKFAVWGAVGGILLFLFPFVLVRVGLASAEGSPHSTATVVAAIAPVFIALSALSAVGSLLLARRAQPEVVVAASTGAPGGLGTSALSEGTPDLEVATSLAQRQAPRVDR